ncbi:hypothetical protein EHS25_001191 [Saitozyma podzolica]|uniref:Uncharacterized protein n=1 Tax=Saitozyma podzolica TaxID=1890683 RepID=A0A427YHH0_9TREE|nr:hypothetical protein EHS25_001191 [Saitozyma podzolica]
MPYDINRTSSGLEVRNGIFRMVITHAPPGATGESFTTTRFSVLDCLILSVVTSLRVVIETKSNGIWHSRLATVTLLSGSQSAKYSVDFSQYHLKREAMVSKLTSAGQSSGVNLEHDAPSHFPEVDSVLAAFGPFMAQHPAPSPLPLAPDLRALVAGQLPERFLLAANNEDVGTTSSALTAASTADAANSTPPSSTSTPAWYDKLTPDQRGVARDALMKGLAGATVAALAGFKLGGAIGAGGGPAGAAAGGVFGVLIGFTTGAAAALFAEANAELTQAEKDVAAKTARAEIDKAQAAYFAPYLAKRDAEWAQLAADKEAALARLAADKEAALAQAAAEKAYDELFAQSILGQAIRQAEQANIKLDEARRDLATSGPSMHQVALSRASLAATRTDSAWSGALYVARDFETAASQAGDRVRLDRAVAVRKQVEAEVQRAHERLKAAKRESDIEIAKEREEQLRRDPSLVNDKPAVYRPSKPVKSFDPPQRTGGLPVGGTLPDTRGGGRPRDTHGSGPPPSGPNWGGNPTGPWTGTSDHL